MPRAAAKSSPRTERYSAQDIEVLEGLEPVRRRPGMYIGGTDEVALHHLAAEVLDNAMDEVVAGHATWIDMTLEADGSVTVRDNGRGIPVDPHPRFSDKSALEIVLTTLHAGGKFGGEVYKTAGGLHGVGISVVNALSDRMTVEVARDQTLWAQTYSRGEPDGPLKNAGSARNRRGTSVQFHPDPGIFGDSAALRADRLYALARSKAYLSKGVEIRWRCAEERRRACLEIPAEDTLCFPRRTCRRPERHVGRFGADRRPPVYRRGGAQRRRTRGMGDRVAGRRTAPVPVLLQHGSDLAGRDAR